MNSVTFQKRNVSGWPRLCSAYSHQLERFVQVRRQRFWKVVKLFPNVAFFMLGEGRLRFAFLMNKPK
jgi:hypothetical protein